MLLPGILGAYTVILYLQHPDMYVMSYFKALMAFNLAYLVSLGLFIREALKRRVVQSDWPFFELYIILSFVVAALFCTYLYGLLLTMGLLLLFIGISIVCTLGNAKILYHIFWWVAGFILFSGFLEFFGLVEHAPILAGSAYQPDGRPTDWLSTVLLIFGATSSAIMFLVTVSVERWVEREERFKETSMLDDLTGLMNRRTFLSQATLEIGRSQRRLTQYQQASYLGCIMLDLDHFKSINDTFGHDAGDEVLRLCGGLVAKQVRPYDLVGRFGGEEFAILLPGADHSASVEIASRICEAINNLILQAQDRQINVTASLGVTCHQATSSRELDALIKTADEALYMAKKQGRNQVVFKTFNGDHL